MPTVTTSTERRDGVTYVAVRIDNRIEDPVVEAHSVRLQTDVTPIWVPTAEQPQWVDGVVTVDVPVGTVRGVGFATPEDPEDCSVDIDDVRPADDEPAATSPSPRTVLQALGDPRPPRDAVPIGSGMEAAETATGSADGEADPAGGGEAVGAEPTAEGGHAVELEPGEQRVPEPEQAVPGDREGGEKAVRSQRAVPGDRTAEPATSPHPEPTGDPSSTTRGHAADGRTTVRGSIQSPRGRTPADRAGLPQDVAAILEPDPDSPNGEQCPAPAPVEQWLAGVEDRIGSDSTAARAADRAHLRRVERKVGELLERIDADEGPKAGNGTTDRSGAVEEEPAATGDDEGAFDWIGGDRTAQCPEVRE